ncbi:MAG: metal ABC transporter permease [Corynebacterium casei]|uniref:Iron/manganese/zinc ABC transporter, inner membrane subunit n=2 Tax=Corynebacterium casei TaxID=160386 RepID=G7I0Y3_9CORY|nr:metal ABC transporter permease [Corynebacterium casei]AHI19074.1 manganese ABC transport system membrane protein [Corynebacterium casei LMG S-19264]MDN5706863.1 metal ABC transporter permease [Corynebacterium casei]MDN5729444.1 metal ABC transporter permease [Corynebacterium casei]MDN5741125.1 metal ABC transporter permease [Corynebacterium casei]MDN5783414.1 metal ABC transporter permease [Corynebacterium casei]
MTLALSACLLAITTALACAIPGVFVVLKRDSMLIDGIGHAVLPGIAVGYMFTADLNSPWLLLTAALGGLMVALLTEWIGRSGLITNDAALGLIFPALFAAGIILISTHLSHVHLDVHAVLVGDLNLVAFSNPGYSLVMLVVAIVNAAFILLCMPRLTTATFDSGFSRVAGIRTRGLHTIFIALVAATATAAFHAAGAMLVIALMVFPAICARLLSNRVPTMLAVACGVALCGAPIGFWLAYHANASTSAFMAVAYAGIFILILGFRFLISPRRRSKSS